MSIATPVLGVINAGSSSLKFAVYDGEALVLSGQVDGIGVHPGIRVTGARGEALDAPDIAHASPTVPADVLPYLLPWLREQLGGLMARVSSRAPVRRLVTIEEVGAACVFLASPYAAVMTGETLYIDGGYHILA